MIDLNNKNRLDTGQKDFSSKSQQESCEKVSNATKRMSITLSGDIANLLEYLASSQGITQNEALRKAIATEGYLLEERQQGSKILIQKPDKEIREVLFR
ncbi:DUF2188 domain-containing protein [Anabaena cylindrica FACHB-243]|uniref:Ribbon-helix-helix protein CopG domain-containing protein n=1 Tax=Anabaena cylindrica (strain ATCC 27899 / PCC 7122) TaxID=272123 RepID=K9ZQJ7_ANACC|nr:MULTISPECIES: DUF2188 domain-containing protein [Anabaena]AFZ61451.1 hypothetical protein Anacy_6182 [Anabaena cylindrica PCC 7122]MBD2421535.1 DUF2188 domain-containing protein [Anabaena cylindrica FACHB-243]MBY5284234.1 hypothetical protein [Anabaena sp. CCAP 1446/1C]MBY5310605.1 hypothetical protein [Anabaena sp. CCAP 1446/1C]MCM2405951.1 DUF2188 domain-containing protein [Anabaena sp. CCAP 1446/1C]